VIKLMDPEVDVLAPMFSSALGLLRDRLDEIVDEISNDLLDAVPLFSHMPVEFHALLRETSRKFCEALFKSLGEGEITYDIINWGDIPGVELGDILRAFKVGSEVAWRWIRQTFEEAGYPPEETLKAAEMIWQYYFFEVNSASRTFVKQRQEAVNEFNSLLNHVRLIQDREELMRKITEGACISLGYRRAVFFLFEHEMLIPLSAMDRLDPTWGGKIIEEQRRYPISPLAATLESRALFEPAIKMARAELRESVAFITPQQGAFYALIPVNPAGSTRGLLYIETDAPLGAIRERDLEILSAYADTVGMALQNLQLYREVEAKRRVMDQLMSRVNRAHEEERARIARELHDSVAQTLLKIIYSAGFALDFLKEDPAFVVEEIEEVQQRAKDCLRELRVIMSNLRPTPLDILGLKETILRYAEQYEEEYAISTSVDLKGLDSIPPSVELTVFRILQEELANVRKHSNADSVRISLETSQGDVILTVEDDGVGFDPKTLPAEQDGGKHMGLMAMRERAELLGGNLIIASQPGEGTRITVSLPMISGSEA
jgi:signal transduction histidine kinase